MTEFKNQDTYPNGFTKQQIFHAVSPAAMSLTLLPTEKCNFRCTYCYEDFAVGKMSVATQRAIELLLSSRMPSLKLLNLSWFGGEPLLAKEVVLRIAKHAFHLAREHNVNFHGGLTTNAYLLSSDLAEELISHKQNFFQITLDGYGEEHDKLRRRADGKGTFDRIWDNLRALQNLHSEFDCCIRVHVRRDNIENLEILMREIAREMGADRRFRVDFQHLRNMGGHGGKTVVSPLSLGELEQAKRHLTEVYKGEMSSILSPTLISIPSVVQRPEFKFAPPEQLPKPTQARSESAGSQRKDERNLNEPYICYASKPNNLLIRATGRIGKCTVALDDERNDIGYLADDGRIVISQEKHFPWFRGLETLDKDIVGCPIKGMPNLQIASPMREQRVVFINR